MTRILSVAILITLSILCSKDGAIEAALLLLALAAIVGFVED